MSLAEKERRPRHIKRGKDLRRHVKERDDRKEAKKEIFNAKNR